MIDDQVEDFVDGGLRVGSEFLEVADLFTEHGEDETFAGGEVTVETAGSDFGGSSDFRQRGIDTFLAQDDSGGSEDCRAIVGSGGWPPIDTWL
ncbi:hypothetical protein GCM10027088_62010 [Nocardia goodfellowii]